MNLNCRIIKIDIILKKKTPDLDKKIPGTSNFTVI